VIYPNFCKSTSNSDVCQAAKDVNASQEALTDLFGRIENFFKRLESYTEVPPTDAMTDMIVKIMVEVLNIFAIATKEMNQGRASVSLPGSSWLQANLCTEKFLKKLVGRKDIEDALMRLDKLTQDEARMAAAQILKLTHVVDNKVTGVGNKLKEMEDKIDVVIKGAPDMLAIYRPILIARMLARWKGYKSGYPANVKPR
jgi:hypothetical protein